MKNVIFILLLFCSTIVFSQVKKDTIKEINVVTDTMKIDHRTAEDVSKEIDSANVNKKKSKIISPTKAGLYSAVMPGLGQFYNRKYWKVPIVWGAVGTGVGIAIWNQNQYNRYRKAFIASLNGEKHEFSDIPGITPTVLGNTQDKAKRQRDYAIAITAAIYLLNIIDAVVDAHLAPMKNDPDLAFAPVLIQDPIGLQTSKVGLGLSFRF